MGGDLSFGLPEVLGTSVGIKNAVLCINIPMSQAAAGLIVKLSQTRSSRWGKITLRDDGTESALRMHFTVNTSCVD